MSTDDDRARAEALFDALRAASSDDDDEFEQYEQRRYTKALETVLTAAYFDLATEYHWPDNWPQWAHAMAAIDLDETTQMLYDWVRHQLDKAGLLPTSGPQQP